MATLFRWGLPTISSAPRDVTILVYRRTSESGCTLYYVHKLAFITTIIMRTGNEENRSAARRKIEIWKGLPGRNQNEYVSTR